MRGGSGRRRGTILITLRGSWAGWNGSHRGTILVFCVLECVGAGNVEGCSPLQFPLQFYIERQALVGATILNFRIWSVWGWVMLRVVPPCNFPYKSKLEAGINPGGVFF